MTSEPIGSSLVGPLLRWPFRQSRYIIWRLIDAVLGVRTTPREPLGINDAYGSNFTALKPCGWLTLYRVFRLLNVDRDDVLLDIGSGAGRALLVASQFPFKRVIGVECIPALCAHAKKNIESCRLTPKTSISIVCADIDDYEVPSDLTVMFLYNPFVGRVFHDLTERIFDLVDNGQRSLRLVYVNPKEHAYLSGTGRCRLIKQVKAFRPGQAWSMMLTANIYAIEPEGSFPTATSTVR